MNNELLVIDAAAPRERLDEHDCLLREFMADTFSVDSDEATDLYDGTLLLDFTGAWPRWMGGAATATRSTRAHWDCWLVNDIIARYGVLPSAGIETPLVILLDQIAAARRRALQRPH